MKDVQFFDNKPVRGAQRQLGRFSFRVRLGS